MPEDLRASTDFARCRRRIERVGATQLGAAIAQACNKPCASGPDRLTRSNGRRGKAA